jgi:superfamily I DNA and/or RNA helicase
MNNKIPTLKEIIKEVEEVFKEIPKTCHQCKSKYIKICKPCNRKLKTKKLFT